MKEPPHQVEGRGSGDRLLLLLALVLVVIWGGTFIRTTLVQEEEGVGWQDFFGSDSKSREEPYIHAMRRYFESLKYGDRDALLEVVIPPDDAGDRFPEVVDFVLLCTATISDFHAAYGGDSSTIEGLELTPLHSAKDLETASWSGGENSRRVDMPDGASYYLLLSDGQWRVRWPGFTLRGAALNADVAQAVTTPVAEVRAVIGRHFIRADDLKRRLYDTLDPALVPFRTEQWPANENAYPIHDLAEIQPQPVDADLRIELEEAYANYRKALTAHDAPALFDATIMKSGDREVFDKQIESGEVPDFIDWVLMNDPPLEKTVFVTIKTDGDDFAAYYYVRNPPYSDEYQELARRQFEKTGSGWKMLYQTNQPANVPLSVADGEDLTAKILEEIETNPLVRIQRPVRNTTVAHDAVDTALKDELAAAYDAFRKALADDNVDAVLTMVRASLMDEDRIASKHWKLFPQILAYHPPRDEATFVTVRRHGKNIAAYFHVVAEPINPKFENVAMVPFVYHDGRWKVILDLDAAVRMGILHAKGDGDKVSRGLELVDMPGSVFDLELIGVMFEDALMSDDERAITLARAAITNDDDAAALAHLSSLTEQGRNMPRAQAAMGLLYARGNAVGRDFARAVELFRCAAAQGDGDAFYYLGHAFERGEGVRTDQVMALACFEAGYENDLAEPEADRLEAVLEAAIEQEDSDHAADRDEEWSIEDRYYKRSSELKAWLNNNQCTGKDWLDTARETAMEQEESEHTEDIAEERGIEDRLYSLGSELKAWLNKHRYKSAPGTTRLELETVYERYIQALEDCDFEALQSVLWFHPTDKYAAWAKDELASRLTPACEYLRLLDPKLSDTTYIEHKVYEKRDTVTGQESVAYYYFVWTPPPLPTWAQFVKNITPRPEPTDGQDAVTYKRFIRVDGQWKLDFSEGFEPHPSFEQPLEKTGGEDLHTAAGKTIEQWLLPEEEAVLHETVLLRFLRLENAINISAVLIPLLLTLAAWHDYNASRQTLDWPTTTGQVVTLDSRGNFAYEYDVGGKQYSSSTLDFSDHAARCRHANSEHYSAEACSGHGTWLSMIHTNPYYSYRSEELEEAVAAVTSAADYSVSENEDEGKRYRAAKKRAYDISRHLSEGDSVTVHYRPANPETAILFPHGDPRAPWPKIYTTILLISAGMTLFIITGLIPRILGWPEWSGNAIFAAVVVAAVFGSIWYWKYGTTKSREDDRAVQERQYERTPQDNGRVWQTAEGDIFLSFFDRCIKRKNYVPCSKVVYGYRVNGAHYRGVDFAYDWEFADTYREHARVEVRYLESDPSVSSLGEVIW